MTASPDASKGADVEEWIDLRFFRPIGARVARALAPTRVSPDAVTMWSLAIGLVAGHCFLYRGAAINLAGFALFVVSDIFDSADGQLARMRGTSTRFGRLLDGLSDNLRFINLYLHLIARLLAGGGGWAVVVLGVAAGVSHSWQSAAADFVRNAYLRVVWGTGELDLPEDVGHAAPLRTARLATRLYRTYVARQAQLFPRTVALVRRLRRLGGVPPALADAYRRLEHPLVARCAWIGQNIRWALVGVAGVLGLPSAFFWATVVPLNAVLVGIVRRHEDHVAVLAADLPAADAAELSGSAPAHAG